MRNFILGTDWWTDCDDAVALRLLLNEKKRKNIDLIGIVVNAVMDCSIASVDGFLQLENETDIPIGVDLAGNDFGGFPPYQKRLSEYAARYKSNSDAEDAVHLYRRLLASSDDKVEIIEIGFLQAFAALLLSEGDDISPLCGIDLVREKVSRCWIMAGKWDKDGDCEHNFAKNRRSIDGGMTVLEKCPVPITFLGWEVGYGVITGDELDRDDHLYRVLIDHKSENGRHSWDPMTVLLAIVGDLKSAGYRSVVGKASLDAADGANHFTECKGGPHAYVIKKKNDSYYKDEINKRISKIKSDDI